VHFVSHPAPFSVPSGVESHNAIARLECVADHLPVNREYASLPPLLPDADIAQSTKLLPIGEIAAKLGLSDHEWEPYGRYKAKIELDALTSRGATPNGKLILVTAMTATKFGDGKTVTSIGLSQGLSALGERQVLCLREPSLGPTFGIKGGAAGGGHAQVLPMDEINMHFTGDLHAITAAHNLLAAILDNRAYFERKRGDGPQPTDLDSSRTVWRRAMDLCDRQLRHCEIGLGKPSDGFPHSSGFDITAASEIMAIVALSSSRKELRERLGRIVLGFNRHGDPVRAADLDCIGALEVLLKDALRPNLVQTTDHTPALIHCGPFANIAHGCNSILATRLGLKLGDWAVTEAGFAADLGAEKFLNIKCRQLGFMPACAVVVVTCRALKLHGGVDTSEMTKPNVAALEAGFANVRVHLENLRKFGIPAVVAINRFGFDSDDELNKIAQLCRDMNVQSALSQVAHFAGKGGMELASAVKETAREGNRPLAPLYPLPSPLLSKLETLAREIYRADGVDLSKDAQRDLEELERIGIDELPICVAKTQHSLSDQPNLRGAPTGFRLQVSRLKLSAGAGFVVAQTGSLMLMPGMPSEPTVSRIGLDDQGRVFGLS
jgi:formate--tetrahydrofolate ligase